MKKFTAIFLLLAIVISSSVFVFASDQSGTCGEDVGWSFDRVTGTLHITGSGAMTEWGSESFVPWAGIKNDITSVVIDNGVTSIGAYSFYGCSNLSKATLGSSITSIGAASFASCTSLDEITLPESVSTIYNWALSGTGLKKLIIPANVASMSYEAVADCASLSRVVILSPDIDLGNYSVGFDYEHEKTDLTICSFSYSNSDEYAQKYDIDFEPLKYGDLNLDAFINAKDSLQLKKYLSGSAADTNKRLADLNRDTYVNAKDSLFLKRIISGAASAPVDEPEEINPSPYTDFEYPSKKRKIYVVGDSTAAYCTPEYMEERRINGWAQRLREFTSRYVDVYNHAMSGRSSRSYITEYPYTNIIFNEIKPGDYLFIQFAHNDSTTGDPERGAYVGLDFDTLDENGMNEDGQYSFEWILYYKYVVPALEKGAVPVLLTSISYRQPDTGLAINGPITEYVKATRKLAKKYGLVCLDVNHEVDQLYAETVKAGGAAATEEYHAIFKSEDGLSYTMDNCHLSPIGAYKVSYIVTNLIHSSPLELTTNFQTDMPFDPED